MALIDSFKSLSAADKLRDLLVQVEHIDSPPSLHDPSTPSESSNDSRIPNELYLLVQTSEEITQQLKEENAVLRDDNLKLRSNVVALIEENNRLHEEMRSTFISDMLRLINLDDGRPTTDKESQIVDLYSKKMRSLEIELKDAKEKLNKFEAVWHPSNDVMNCVQCGALLPFGQHTCEHNEKVANIITENEANKRRLQQIQIKLDQIQDKEQKTLAKFQESIAIAEQNQFDRSEAIVERDQIKIELAETQKRLKSLINEMNDRIANEKQNIEIICQERLKENAEQIKQLGEKCSEYELTIDRLAREKTSLTAELNLWKERIQRQENDLSQTADSVKFQIQKAMRERDQANHTTMQIRSDFEKLLSQSTQDSVQLRQQLNSAQTRLNAIENELLDSKKQCLDLTEEINRLTRENIMLKNVKQTLERAREENLDAIGVILNQREENYRNTIESLELERHQSLAHLENLVSNQNKILKKLRSYSQHLTEEIEIIHEKKHESVQEMTVENQELRMKLSNAYERLEQTNTQLLEHGNLHLKLKQRVVQLNNQVKEYENIINKINIQDLRDNQQQKPTFMLQQN